MSIEKGDLGKRYKDRISGFEGVAVAVASYLNGCNRVTLEGGNDSQEPKAFVFDDFQLEPMGDEVVIAPTTSQAGGVDRWTPTRR